MYRCPVMQNVIQLQPQSKDVDRLFLAIADRGAKDGKLALYQHNRIRQR
jgi:hypothetical protein